MSSEHLNRGFVDEQVERLRAEYGPVPVSEETVEVEAGAFPEYVENARDGYVGSAYTWTVRAPEQAAERSESYSGGVEDRERALLVLPRGESAWGVPGGGLEGEESVEDAAVRETREEAGVDCEIAGLWHLNRCRWRSEDDADGRVSHTLHVYFDAEYTGGSVAVQASEVNGAAWFAERPARLGEPSGERADAFF
ncbi:NUDIX hydrolase [Halobacterium jilantaiense]|uniref:ADP-ribose pyrophosphatase YjhB, NUDIX family n=1 Tax=Halobacterium jilantaiense TaxID=355548 RepID=A0A1I0MHE3_9EURY|nr:NUDIX domain-containing protein [Halobacterium jilantaiense]SEV87783.1 ADP-ribose pyrophosphatase YjhB, NUDIX family [Halobacterium jilantaiense]